MSDISLMGLIWIYILIIRLFLNEGSNRFLISGLFIIEKEISVTLLTVFAISSATFLITQEVVVANNSYAFYSRMSGTNHAWDFGVFRGRGNHHSFLYPVTDNFNEFDKNSHYYIRKIGRATGVVLNPSEKVVVITWARQRVATLDAKLCAYYNIPMDSSTSLIKINSLYKAILPHISSIEGCFEYPYNSLQFYYNDPSFGFLVSQHPQLLDVWNPN